MTYKTAVLSLLVILVMPVGTAYAQYNCSAAPVYVPIGPYPYWEYTKNPLTQAGDASCWILSAGFTPGSLDPNCSYYADGWEFTGGNSKTMTHTFTVGQNDAGSSSWSLDFNLDFYDPYSDWYSQLRVDVVVTHNGVSKTHRIYFHTGNEGADCGGRTGSFTAVNGDTVKVIFRANNYLGAHIAFNNVRILRWA